MEQARGQRPAEAPLRLSPLDHVHRRLGARMVPFGGWEMPLHYPTGAVAEHMACRTGAAVFDVSHLGTVRVEGPDAFERLQWALSNDLAKIGPGRAQYTHLLDDDGSVLDDIIVWWVDEYRFDVMPNASNTSRALAALGGADVTAERAVLAVQGPGARAAVGQLLPEAAEVGRSCLRRVPWRGHEVVVAGTGYTGEDGLECAVPAAAAGAFWQSLTGPVPAGLGARDTLRLEAGLPLHGHELGPGINPLEAGLSWVVAWDKPGGFRGREALMACRQEGARRALRGIVAHGRQPLREGYGVLVEGRAVGALTSGNFSPVLGCGIGLGFVPSQTDYGARVQVEARGRRLDAQVTRLPFVPRGRAGAAQADHEGGQ